MTSGEKSPPFIFKEISENLFKKVVQPSKTYIRPLLVANLETRDPPLTHPKVTVSLVGDNSAGGYGFQIDNRVYTIEGEDTSDGILTAILTMQMGEIAEFVMKPSLVVGLKKERVDPESVIILLDSPPKRGPAFATVTIRVLEIRNDEELEDSIGGRVHQYLKSVPPVDITVWAGRVFLVYKDEKGLFVPTEDGTKTYGKHGIGCECKESEENECKRISVDVKPMEGKCDRVDDIIFKAMMKKNHPPKLTSISSNIDLD